MSPFGYGRGEGVDAGHGDPEWICSKEKPQYDEIFKSLNPIDGKVTGAGKELIPRALTLARIASTYPHLRNTITVDSALQALLSTTQNCSQLTELCMLLKNQERKDEEHSFDKIAEVLALATQNCSNISQFLMNESSISLESSHSGNVSIHSLHEPLIDHRDDSDTSSDSNRPETYKTDQTDHSNSDDSCHYTTTPKLNIINQTNEQSGIFQTLLFPIKFILLLILNLITITIATECMFICLVYIFTGKLYIEFNIARSPQTWAERVKELTFGIEEETVQIKSIFQLFQSHNVIHILKYLTSRLKNENI